MKVMLVIVGQCSFVTFSSGILPITWRYWPLVDQKNPLKSCQIFLGENHLSKPLLTPEPNTVCDCRSFHPSLSLHSAFCDFGIWRIRFTLLVCSPYSINFSCSVLGFGSWIFLFIDESNELFNVTLPYGITFLVDHIIYQSNIIFVLIILSTRFETPSSCNFLPFLSACVCHFLKRPSYSIILICCYGQLVFLGSPTFE